MADLLKDLKFDLSRKDNDSGDENDPEDLTDLPELPRPAFDPYLALRPFNEREMYFYTLFMPEGYGTLIYR